MTTTNEKAEKIARIIKSGPDGRRIVEEAAQLVSRVNVAEADLTKASTEDLAAAVAARFR